jgi:hypothetical protein
MYKGAQVVPVDLEEVLDTIITRQNYTADLEEAEADRAHVTNLVLAAAVATLEVE